MLIKLTFLKISDISGLLKAINTNTIDINTMI